MLFFAVFFTLYGLLNYYIFIRGWQAIPPASGIRPAYLIFFLVFSLSFIAGRLLERVWLSPLSEVLVWMGSFWLAAMLYLFIAVWLLDTLRLIDHFFPFFPSSVTANYEATKLRIAAGVTILVVILLAAGFVNTLIVRTKEIGVTLAKPMQGRNTMTIVAASDIHLGTIIGNGRLRTIVSTINALGPDLILLPGDIVDEDLGPVIRENLGETLRDLRAPLGVYAVTGNHEYIGGAEAACRYLEEHGVRVLRDSAVRLPNGVLVVGREDLSRSQFAGQRRKTLEQVMAGTDVSGPVILMDHQPFRLEEGARNGADLQLSGHTHHGQLWPLGLITKAVYEVSWGYTKKGRTHIYVSCGVGTWGPPVRIGSAPEIIRITLTCNGSEPIQ